jgi:hypothetical protein
MLRCSGLLTLGEKSGFDAALLPKNQANNPSLASVKWAKKPKWLVHKY